MSGLARRCVDRLLGVDPSIDFQTGVTIVGHSYGSILATYIRRAHPVQSTDVKTVLLEPVLYRANTKHSQDLMYGLRQPSFHCSDDIVRWLRFYIVTHGLRDLHLLYGAGSLFESTDGDPVNNTDVMGHLTMVAGEYDNFCGSTIGKFPDITWVPKGMHGDILNILTQLIV
jgi:pimeloyl-ACP methyl ester carboxylesterase